jgi:outer membrane protein OmpA-like peptidoglycan-associated protein
MLNNLLAMVLLLGLIFPSGGHAAPEDAAPPPGSLAGQVVFAGRPLVNSILAFFDVRNGLPPIAGQEGRTPEMLAYSGPDGRFNIQLGSGSYYLGVLIRTAGTPLGPPRKGEIFYFADGGEGKLRRLLVEGGKETDYGTITCLLPDYFSETEGRFTVIGRVVGGEGEGEPFPGVIVMATSRPTEMRPEYVSAETGGDGQFSLSLPAGKAFSLMARVAITGQRPGAGESIGRYGATSFESPLASISKFGPPPGVGAEKPEEIVNADQAITVSGEVGQVISGLVIRMHKMPDPDAIQSKLRNTAEAPKYESGAALNNLLFATGSAELLRSSFQELDAWVKFLAGQQEITIELNGHTDSVGDDRYNLILSRQRAQAVAEHLAGRGVDSARITVNGYGSLMPVADNAIAEGRAKNRRVEIKFQR